jgi:hypothetical protein
MIKIEFTRESEKNVRRYGRRFKIEVGILIGSSDSRKCSLYVHVCVCAAEYDIDNGKKTVCHEKKAF